MKNSEEQEEEEVIKGKEKKFTFTIKGDFMNDGFTRASTEYMKADGVEMTDLWVYDVAGDEVLQSVKLTPESENWGAPVMKLALGSHHIYFIASRGTNMAEDGYSIKWDKVNDTFWADYEVDVKNTSNGNRAVTLDRIIAKLTVKITDAIPVGAKTCRITFENGAAQMNYKTGLGSMSKHVVNVAIVESAVGMQNAQISAMTLTPNKEIWEQNISIELLDADGKVMSCRNAVGVQMQRNKITNLSGELSGESTAQIGLASEWGGEINEDW